MECKAFPTGYVRGTWTYVLIETLWNVKTNFMQNDNIENLVLIETLWNVKKILSPDWFSVKNGINRNIMECKVRYKGN